MDILLYGAKSIALSTCKALNELYPEFHILGFVVTSKEGNPVQLNGYRVYEISEIQDKKTTIVVATPENTHKAIVGELEKKGFYNHICLDSEKESELMWNYFNRSGDVTVI